MASIFTKIINRELSANIVAEDENYLAFLDIAPLVIGHTLVIPKHEVDYIFDLEDDELSGLHIFSKKVARAIQRVIPCERVGVTVIGIDVPHAHIHLIPFGNMDDMNFSRMKLSPTNDELADTAKIIAESFKQ